jgi:hypothetical protein
MSAPEANQYEWLASSEYECSKRNGVDHRQQVACDSAAPLGRIASHRRESLSVISLFHTE